MTEYTIDPERYANINLSIGAHQDSEHGTCLMEAVSYLVGELHTDHPRCVSAVLADYGRTLNDTLPDHRRQELKGLIPSLPGTINDGFSERRGFMAVDWLVRTWLPTLLELHSHTGEIASELRNLERITDVESIEATKELVKAACDANIFRPTGFITCQKERDARYTAHPASCVAWNAGLEADDLTDGVLVAAGRSPMLQEDFPESVVEELQSSAVDLFAEMIKNPR